MGDIHLNNTLVLIRTTEQDYQPTANIDAGFNQLADVARKALKADKGVIPFAEAPSREYPVYIEAPDKDLRHRIREGAISPDNPYYAELAALCGTNIEFPKTIQPPEPHLFEDTIFSARVREHPGFTEHRDSLEAEIRDCERHRDLARATVLRREAPKILEDILLRGSGQSAGGGKAQR